jgi:1-acyl-sn-glycerol-3-phosphate acyltransferase
MSRWQRVHRLDGFTWCFERYLHWLVRRSFASIRVRDDATLPSDGGYIAASSHQSWWDGFIPFLVHRDAGASRPYALLMSDTELRRFPFFRWGGAFSIDASSVRAAREAILYAGELARDGAGVWIFPDGVLRLPGRAPEFSSGFVHAARAGGVPIVPVAQRYMMLERQRPEAFVAIGAPIDAGRRDAREQTQASVAALLEQIENDVRDERHLARYRRLLAGAAGVDDRIGAVAVHIGKRL